MSEKYMIRVQRDDEQVRAAVAEAASTVVADYGHSLLVQLEENAAEQLATEGYRCRLLPRLDRVRIGAYAIDTVAAEAEAEIEAAHSLAADSIGPSHPELLLLRLAGPMHPDWKRGLKDMGATILQREAADHYLARADSDRMNALRGLEYVESVQRYHSMLKINQALLAAGMDEAAATPAFMSLRLDPAPTAEESAEDLPRMLSSTPLTAAPEHEANLEVTLFSSAQLEAAVAQLEAADVDIVKAAGDTILLQAELDQVPSLASIVEIRQIDPFYPPRLSNNVATDIINAEPLRNDFGLDGSGQVVAVADSGLDTGDAQTVLADFSGRVVNIHAHGRPNDASDPHGHGTHVAGSILGNGALSNDTVQGIAPGARLVFQSLLDAAGGLGGLDTGLPALFEEARQGGARLHNHSWGSTNSNGAYLADAFHADEFAFKHRDFLILFAAGNDGPTVRVSSPGSAKNVLTVGASESLRPLPTSVSFPPSPKFPAGPALSGLDRQADDTADVADFSCPGPVAQGRRKPDVVAPGTWILSCRSSEAKADTGPDGLPDTGDENGDATHADAVGRGLPGQPILGQGSVNTPPLPAGAGQGAEEHYMYDSGTSMACPITTGACALVRQFFIEQRQHEPSAALLKALLVNGAVDVGVGVPHTEQGWGRIDLRNTLSLEEAGLHFDDSLEHALEATEAHGWEVTPLDPEAVVSVTLVWQDPQGPTIQNPLHLVVRHDASGDEFTADSNFNVRNNVQKVVVEPREAEERWVIEVEALDVAQGVPEHKPDERQDFSLVVSNVRGLVQIF